MKPFIPSYMTITHVLPPIKKEKYIKLICTVYGGKLPEKGEHWTVLRTEKVLTIKGVEKAGRDTVTVRIKGIAKKELASGDVLTPRAVQPEYGTSFVTVLEKRKRLHRGKRIKSGKYVLECDNFPVTGNTKNAPVSVAIRGPASLSTRRRGPSKEGVTGNQHTSGSYYTIIEINTDTPLFLFPFSLVSLVGEDHTDTLREGEMQVRVIMGGGVPVANRKSYYKRVMRIIKSTGEKTEKEGFFSGPTARQLYRAGLSARGWMPKVNGLCEQSTSCLLVAGTRWYVTDDFFKKKKRELEKAASVEGGIEREELLSKLDIPRDLAGGIVEHAEVTNDSLSGRYLVTQGPHHEELSPMSKQFSADLLEAGTKGIEMNKSLPERTIRQYHKLVRTGHAVVLGNNILYHKKVYDAAVAKIREELMKRKSMSVGEVKTLFSLTRKTAIPLIEKLEDDGIIGRDENLRIVEAIALPPRLERGSVLNEKDDSVK